MDRTSDNKRNLQRRQSAFTLIELLVVISIISLLISILLPSLSRARDQAKGVHCLAKLKELGTAIAAYENVSEGLLPPARWFPDVTRLSQANPNDVQPMGTAVIEYGWAELLFEYVYSDKVRVPNSYPVLRNIEGQRWQEYFICKAVGDLGVSSGHYRVYLPGWSPGSYMLDPDGRYSNTTHANPIRSGRRERARPNMVLIGDANEESERGDGLGVDDSSYIDAGEANIAGSKGRRTGNSFSDRHYGGTNYLYQDLHASWNTKLREELARDYDLNHVVDITVAP